MGYRHERPIEFHRIFKGPPPTIESLKSMYDQIPDEKKGSLGVLFESVIRNYEDTALESLAEQVLPETIE